MSFHLNANKLVDLDQAVGTVADGAIVALGRWGVGPATDGSGS